MYRYQLAEAMRDGFVKDPAVVTRKDFTTAGLTRERIEEIKLEDGVRMHERVKVDLATYARETTQPLVKPFMLVIARDVTHASQLLALVESEAFFDGRYKGKVLQVDSSRSGAEEDAMVENLLRVEQADNQTEIVIHVNMLKEGWDVTNLYTIVPLRAANARTLVEQSIGRGLRLPYGRRTGVTALDRLSIVAHDRFQEIVDDANRADSPVKIQAMELTPEDHLKRLNQVRELDQLAEAGRSGGETASRLTADERPTAWPGVSLDRRDLERRRHGGRLRCRSTLETEGCHRHRNEKDAHDSNSAAARKRFAAAAHALSLDSEIEPRAPGSWRLNTAALGVLRAVVCPVVSGLLFSPASAVRCSR